jgi:hypothetical protein
MTIAGSIAYGALVFLGMAGLGFVALPALGLASGLFAIDAEARAFFSLLTLKSVPYLLAASTLCAFAYPRLCALPWALRLAAFVANVLVAYAVAVGLGALSLALDGA